MTVEQKTYLRLLLMFVGMCTFVIMFEGWRGPLDQLLLVSSFGITIAYLASMTYLMDYLRRSHTWMWTNLGQPKMPDGSRQSANLQSAKAAFSTLGFMLGTRYRELEDDRLNNLILVIRVLFTATLLLISLVIWRQASMNSGTVMAP